MAEYKNQHFVPEFLLEGWATNGKTVTLHLESGHEQRGQKISEICSRNYLYTTSQDTRLEQELSNLENYQSRPIKKIRQNTLPTYLTRTEKKFLFSYVLTQRFRTRSFRSEIVYSRKNISERLLLNKYQKILDPSQELQISKPTFESLEQGYRQSIAQDHQNYILMHGFFGYLFQDLDIIIAKNKTNIDFVCSDSPIVLDNIRFKHERDTYYPGIGNSGILAYCPISPDHYLILCDPDMYYFNHDGGQLVNIKDKKVVENLNRLQIMNASDILLYTSSADKSYLLSEYETVRKISRFKPIPMEINTTFGKIEYEMFPMQPLPDTGNIFNN